MKVWTCRCEWTWVIGKNKVFGPIFEDNTASTARLQPRKLWQDLNSDCAAQYTRDQRRGHVHAV